MSGFAQTAFAAIDGKPLETQLDMLCDLVRQAERDTLRGDGPPLEEFDCVRRYAVRITNDIRRRDRMAA